MSRHLNAQQKLSVCTVVHPDAHGEHRVMDTPSFGASVFLDVLTLPRTGASKLASDLAPFFPIQIARHVLLHVLLRKRLATRRPPGRVGQPFPFQFGKHAIRQDAYAKPSHVQSSLAVSEHSKARSADNDVYDLEQNGSSHDA